jgi:hypothetical protein
MIILAIDPGTEESAFALWDNKEEKLYDKGILRNIDLLEKLEYLSKDKNIDCHVAIEMIQSYGMPIGKETIETVYWIGQFMHAWKNKNPAVLIFRKDIKLHHCQSMKAKDANIRQSLIDRFGDPGVKKNQGKLYGVSKDVWSAVAIAVYYGDKHEANN